jgi:hypothetical protein
MCDTVIKCNVPEVCVAQKTICNIFELCVTLTQMLLLIGLIELLAGFCFRLNPPFPATCESSPGH